MMNSALTKSLLAIGLIAALAIPPLAYAAGHSTGTSAKPQVQRSNIMKTKHDTVKNSITNVH